MDEVTLEGRGNGKSLGLGKGGAVTVPKSGRVAFGAPGRTGVISLTPGNGGMAPFGAGGWGIARLKLGIVGVRPGEVEFWPGKVGEVPPGKEPLAPKEDMGKVVKLVPLKILEMMSAKGPAI